MPTAARAPGHPRRREASGFDLLRQPARHPRNNRSRVRCRDARPPRTRRAAARDRGATGGRPRPCCSAGAVGDVPDLLRQDEVEQDRLRLDQRVEIASPPSRKRLDAGKPGRGRALHHVVTDREHARRGDDAEQAGFLADRCALGRCEAARTSRAPLRSPPAVSASSLANPISPAAASNALRQRSLHSAPSPCTRRMIEEDVDREQVLRVRAADPVGDPRRARWRASRAIAGSSPSRRPCNRARRPRAGCRRRERRAPRTSDPRCRPGTPSANTRALSWSMASRLSPRPAEPSTANA